MGIQNCRVNWKNKIENVKNWPLRWKFECERLIFWNTQKANFLLFLITLTVLLKKYLKKSKEHLQLKQMIEF